MYIDERDQLPYPHSPWHHPGAPRLVTSLDGFAADRVHGEGDGAEMVGE